MANQHSADSDFTQGSILPKMIKFMIPLLGALILQAMYGAVDMMVVGQFGTTAGISGVSTGGSIVNLVTFTVIGLNMGVTVLIGRYLGEKRNDRVGPVIGGAIVFFSLLGVALMVLMLLFAPQLTQLMQAPEEAVEDTILYVRICGAGLLFIIAYNVISSIFRGLGDSRLPLIFVAIACVVNIIGDLVLVAGFGLNVVGAALATVLAQAVSVVLSLLIIRKRQLPFTVSRKDISFNPEIGRFVRLGLPIAFQEVLTQFSFLALVAFINALGLDASSGYGVANKIVNFVMLIPSSIMQSTSAMVAQNVGAGNEARCRKIMSTAIVIGLCFGVPVCAATWLAGGSLASIFASDAQVIARAAEYLRGFSLEAIVTAVLFSFIGFYNGHGETFWVMVQGLAQSFLVRLPVSYFMSIQPNASLTSIGFAAPAATIFGILINGIFLMTAFKKRWSTKASTKVIDN